MFSYLLKWRPIENKSDVYNAFNVYHRELAPGTVSLTGDRAQGDDSKHWASSIYLYKIRNVFSSQVTGDWQMKVRLSIYSPLRRWTVENKSTSINLLST